MICSERKISPLDLAIIVKQRLQMCNFWSVSNLRHWQQLLIVENKRQLVISSMARRRERDNIKQKSCDFVSKVSYGSLDWSSSGIIPLPHASHHSVCISIISPLWLGINWILCHGCQPPFTGRTIATDTKLSWLEASEPTSLNPVCRSKPVWGFWQRTDFHTQARKELPLLSSFWLCCVIVLLKTDQIKLITPP